MQYAAAISNDPLLLILDEPTVGMDILSKEKFWSNIKNKVENSNLTILLISHDFDEIERFTNRIVILNKGKIVLDKNKDVLLAKKDPLFLLDKKHLMNIDICDIENLAKIIEDDTLYFSYSQYQELIKKSPELNMFFKKEEITINKIFRGIINDDKK
ncbi:hypothetical protein [Staphylococcus lutrae]|uniref:ABC transporter ATP-binding protein n=1 Tax=Staphylococcus lutrae TaxID=155085 RepID=A0AAC9WJK7_9STAP|nr:hypothetical protein [Staphylococcus lutrae]ARJ51434.1 hypothetical protein B5P37_08980 [Staphylococcus lutrae]PNZ34837.1 hypothetical protein CD134_09890 [Staphylococcus lutrae]